MKFYNRKSLIPVDTLILVGHLLPLISVFNGDLDYMHLIALFYFDFVLLIIFGFIKLFGAPYKFSNYSETPVDIYTPEGERLFKRNLRIGYVGVHFFVLIFYSLIICLPIGMHLNLDASPGHNFFNQLVIALNFKTFWILLAALTFAQLGELIAFFIKPKMERNYAEDIAYINYKEYLIIYLVVIIGAFLTAAEASDTIVYTVSDELKVVEQVQIGDSNNWWLGVVFGTGFTIIKLYFERNRKRKMLRKDDAGADQ